jgi:hypothetical protein
MKNFDSFCRSFFIEPTADTLLSSSGVVANPADQQGTLVH